MDFTTVAINYDDAIADEIDDRGVKEEDIREVLELAETTGNKLVNDENGHFLARKRINKFSAYVEYTVDGDAVTVYDVYSHLVTFEDEE